MCKRSLKKLLTTERLHGIMNYKQERERQVIIMDYNINITTVEMNMVKISSEDGATRFYSLDDWTIGAAVENYIEDELME